MRTRVEFKHNDAEHKEWTKGDKGYIDGYVRGGNGVPFAAVVIGHDIVLAPLHSLKVTGLN